MRWLTAYIIGTKKGKIVPEKSALLARVTLDSTVTKSQNQHGPMAYPQYVFKSLHVPSAGRGIPSFTKRCLNASYPSCGKGHTPLQSPADCVHEDGRFVAGQFMVKIVGQ